MSAARRVTAFIAVVAVSVIIAGGAGFQTGHATTSTKYYSNTLLPGGSIGAGATVTETLTLTNSSTSTQTLGSEYVTIPTGYTVTVTSVTVVGGGTWNVSVSGGYIKLLAASSKDALNPGGSVTVGLTVQASCTASGPATWSTEAKQSNSFNGPPGNDFLLVPTTSDPTTTVSGSCQFVFSSIASPQTAGNAINFTVTEEDGSGNPMHFADSATLTSNFLTTHGTPSPTGTGTTLNFGTTGTQVSASAISYTTQTGATLTVSGGGITNFVTFDVQPDVAASLAFGPQPTDTKLGSPVPDFGVTVYDQWGNLETRTDQQQTVGLTIGTDAAGGGTTLGPTAAALSGMTSGGSITFSGVTVSQSGIGFTLVATAGSLTTTSAAFNVYDSECSQTAYSTCSASNSSNNTNITVDYPTQTTDGTTFVMSGLNKTFACNNTTYTDPGSLVTWGLANDANGNPYTWQNPATITLRYDKSIAPGTGVSNFVICIAKNPTNPVFTVLQDCPKHLTSSTVLPCASQRKRNNAGDLIIVMLAATGDPVGGFSG